MTEKANEYKGFSLFNDVEDAQTRNSNRAKILSNIAEDYTSDNKKINPKGVGLILGYFSRVPEGERGTVYEQFKSTMVERGFAIGQ